MTTITIEHHVPTVVQPTERVLATAAMFGLGVDDRRTMTIVPRTQLPLPPGGVVFVTGPSGGGKSTVLRLIQEACRSRRISVIRMENRENRLRSEQPLIDLIAPDQPVQYAMQLLSMAGLGDAFVMLRKPSELSDGQRWRWKLAEAFAQAGLHGKRCVIIADEFAASLDRVTAKVIARNVSRWVARTQHTFIAATTHDDLLESLEPAVLIEKGLGEQIDVAVRAAAPHTTHERG